MSIPAKDSKFSYGKQHVWFGKDVLTEMVLVHEISLIIFKFKEKFFFFTSVDLFLSITSYKSKKLLLSP